MPKPVINMASWLFFTYQVIKWSTGALAATSTAIKASIPAFSSNNDLSSSSMTARASSYLHGVGFHSESSFFPPNKISIFGPSIGQQRALEDLCVRNNIKL